MRAKGAALALVVVATLLSSGPAEAAKRADIVKQVTYNGQTVTVRLHPVTLRAPGFEVLLQQADGNLIPQDVGPERAYLGSVDGQPGAVSSAIINSDNKLEGQVVFDRGATWQFLEGAVYETRGLTPPTEYKWPSATDQSLNVSTAPGQAGSKTYRWDIGFDADNAWFNAAPVSGSVAKALDAIELSAVSLYDVYATNALIRPAVGRIVIRAAIGKDPYGVGVPTLGEVQTEWNTNQAGSGMDSVALLDLDYGGGVAYVATAGTSNGLSINGGEGASRAVLRHELGHNWGAHDNHTKGPEGATINSGNQYERFDGTELSAIFRYRDSRQKATAPFDVVPTLAEPAPPYAALDLVDTMYGGVTYRFRPTLNDHDANLDLLGLKSAQAQSHFGGAVTVEGDVLVYTPPAVGAPVVDWVEYVVRDATGRTATGVSLFRVSPYVDKGPASGWPAQQGLSTKITYDLVNTQSGLPAGLPVKFKRPSKLVQRSAIGDATKIRVIQKGGTYKLKSRATKGCWTVVKHKKKKRVVQSKCLKRGKAQRWVAVVHPTHGTALVNRKYGRCVTPAGASILAGARLALAKCNASQSRSWEFRTPPVSEWAAFSVPAGPRSLTHVQSGSQLGVPDGASGNSDLTLRQAGGAATQFTFTSTATGYEVRNVQNNRCLDVYSNAMEAGAEVGTWSCGASPNQRWRLLANPAGDIAVRSVSSGLCLAVTTVVAQVPCGSDASQRWRIS